MNKINCIQELMNKNDFREFIKYLKIKKHSFTLTSTGYTKTIIWGNNKYTQISGRNDNRMFTLFNMIKSDIIKSDIIIDKIPFYSIDNFKVNNYLRKRSAELPNKLINIDLKSAYLTALHAAGIITEKTYTFGNSIPKMDRLKAVGMLAMQKTSFTYVDGKLNGSPVITEDKFLRNYFFFCCFQISELMNKIAGAYGNNFLFYWVDGLYFNPEINIQVAEKIINDAKYSYRVDYLTGVNFETDDNKLFFSYYDEENKKTKVFNLPFEDEENRKELNRYIKYMAQEERRKKELIKLNKQLNN